MSLLARDVKETRKHQKSEKKPFEKNLKLENVILKGANYFIISVSPGEESILINTYSRNTKLWGHGRKENSSIMFYVKADDIAEDRNVSFF